MSSFVIDDYRLDITPQGNYPVVYLSQFEDGRDIRFYMLNRGRSFTIPTGISAFVSGLKSNGGYYEHVCTIDGNYVIMPVEADMTDVSGIGVANIKLTNQSGDTVISAKFVVNVQESVSDSGVEVPTVAETIFQQLLDEIRQQSASISANVTQLNNNVTQFMADINNEVNVIDNNVSAVDARMDTFIAQHSGVSANATRMTETTLWSGKVYTDGDMIYADNPVTDYDYIDVYYNFAGNSAIQRFTPDVLIGSGGGVIRSANLTNGEAADNMPLAVFEIGIHTIAGDGTETQNFTIDFMYWSWNGQQQSASVQTLGGNVNARYVYKLVGIKYEAVTASKDTELTDIRVGVDGTVYTTAGAAVRVQVAQLKQENTDDIEQLKSELNAFEPSVFYDTTIKRGINLFNKNDSRNKDGYYRDQNGVLIQAAGTGLFLSHPIAVKAGVEYSAIRRNGSYGSNSKGFVVDASGDIVYDIFDCQTKTNASGDTFITFTPEKNCLVQLNLGKDSGTYAGYLKENCMVCKTSDMPSGEVYLSYEPYMTEALTNVDSNRKEPASNIEIVKAGNLFNKDDADIISNKYISYTLMNVDGYYVSHPILVKKGVKYAVTHGDSLGNARMLIYLDRDMNMLPNASFCTQDSTYPDADVFTARMTGYVRVNLGTHPEKIVMCEADNYNGFYCDFGFTLPKLKYPQLYGKIVSFNGDSICAGQGYSGGYGKIIAERNGMIYENIGVNGGTITAETYYQNGNPRHWISRTIENMRADSDYIILEGGVNDSVANIGTVPDVNDYTSTLDDTNYAQAFESMLKKAIDRFKGKKIGYIAIHKCTVTFTSNGNEERNRYTIAINACKKWGIPVCDLNINCLPLGYIDSLKADYTDQGDGWHPNEAGYKAYYVPKIEAWMASL